MENGSNQANTGTAAAEQLPGEQADRRAAPVSAPPVPPGTAAELLVREAELRRSAPPGKAPLAAQRREKQLPAA